MKHFYFLILILLVNIFYTSCKCIYLKKSGFSEFCRSDNNCQDTYLCLNGTCGCETCYYSNKGKCVYSKICEAFSLLNNTQTRLSIATASLRNFVKSSSNKYYVLDYNSKVYVYNQNWVAQSIVSEIGNYYILSAGSSLYFTTPKGILKTDLNFEIQAYYNATFASIDCRSMFYDQEKQEILVACINSLVVQRYDLNLNFISNDFQTIDGLPHGVYMFDNITYVSTLTGKIIKYKNSTKISLFQTLCTSIIHQITIDEAGVMTVPCTSPQAIYMYHVNGTYLNKTINTNSAAMYFDFDLNGRGIVIDSKKVFSI